MEAFHKRDEREAPLLGQQPLQLFGTYHHHRIPAAHGDALRAFALRAPHQLAEPCFGVLKFPSPVPLGAGCRWHSLAVVATCRLLIAPHAAPYLTIWSGINSDDCSRLARARKSWEPSARPGSPRAASKSCPRPLRSAANSPRHRRRGSRRDGASGSCRLARRQAQARQEELAILGIAV